MWGLGKGWFLVSHLPFLARQESVPVPETMGDVTESGEEGRGDCVSGRRGGVARENAVSQRP